MELEQILKLIDAVSKSALTGFSLEEGETKLTLTAERVKEFNPVQQTGEPGIQSGCMQASQAGNRSGVSEERTQSMTTGNPPAMDGYSCCYAAGRHFLQCAVPGRRTICYSGRYRKKRTDTRCYRSNEADE